VSRILCASALRRQITLGPMLQAQLVAGPPAQAVLAWGRKPSALKAEQLAHKLGLPLLRAEDGFLRSFGTGDDFPSLSVVVDAQGIYYDSTGPSDLEAMLASNEELLSQAAEADRAMGLLLEHQLSKYNHAPHMQLPPAGGQPRVLVVDQTLGDMSVRYGAANERTFAHMLQAAIDENPGAQVLGYLSHVQPTQLHQGGELMPLREAANPIGLLQQVSQVYVATSGMGFEALLCGHPVRCFGLPWYAGWGATQDEQHCPRRSRNRTVRELFAAGYLRYTRYLNPATHKRGSIFDVMDWLVRQRRMAGLV
jgi:capsular polysaccharide export protein